MLKRVTNKKEITTSEAKKMMQNISELSQFQQRSFSYVEKFSKVDSSKAEELVGKLIEKFDISRKDAVQVVNCMPQSIEELRVFFSTSRKKIIITSQIEEMLKLIDSYR
jgi:DNA-directed RNA polymerase subunit F